MALSGSIVSAYSALRAELRPWLVAGSSLGYTVTVYSALWQVVLDDNPGIGCGKAVSIMQAGFVDELPCRIVGTKQLLNPIQETTNSCLNEVVARVSSIKA